MEKEFTEWFKANEKRFAHGQFDEKQVAYSAWLEGQKQALRIHDVVGRSEQLKTLLEKLLENNMCSHAGDELIKEALKGF